MDAEEKPYRYVVRFPPQLRDQIVEAAQYYRRSRNSEIVVRLEQSFRGVLADGIGSGHAPPMHSQIESMFGRGLDHDEEKVVLAFRRLPQEKKSALLELLT
jgi:hypothetical protein